MITDQFNPPQTLHWVLEQDTFPLLSTGSTQEDKKLSKHDCKIVDWDVKHLDKQTLPGISC